MRVKVIFLAVLFALMSLVKGYCQVYYTNVWPYDAVQVKPVFEGGDVLKFKQWVSSKIVYPQKAVENVIQGRVVIQCVVAKDGTVKGVTTVRGVHELLSAEAERVVSSSPLWTPGKDENGNSVDVLLTLPIDFKLNNPAPAETPSVTETEKVAAADTAATGVEDAIPFLQVERKPEFQGKDASTFMKWVYSRIEYPEHAKREGKQGRVVVNFTIDVDGSVTNVRVIKGCDPYLDREAVSVVSRSPKWTPGIQRNKPVRVKYTMPIIFMLREATSTSNSMHRNTFSNSRNYNNYNNYRRP